MRNKNLYPVLCAVLVIFIATLACSAVNATPGASDFYMANDKDGNNRTNVFSPTDEFFVFSR